MFIQFGYVTLFSSAFPLAAFWALLNNVIEIRSDAFKLCTTKQRPFGQYVQNIGSWQVCYLSMVFMCLICVRAHSFEVAHLVSLLNVKFCFSLAFVVLTNLNRMQRGILTLYKYQ